MIMQDQRSTPFTGNRPGKKWYSSFLKRHPILAERTAENVSTSQDAVTEKQINNWFKEVKSYLNENELSGILEDPNKIFNADESAFNLSPKPGRVLAKRGTKNVYVTNGDEKENVTVLLTANAVGKIAPPMIVYAYNRIPANIAKKVPETWAIGKSDSGWMCSDTFFEYITNVFNPWLINEGIQKPVLLFVDGHKSHLTLHLSNFCSKNGIEIIALYPNSTHILQPMDIAVFKPLKLFYRKAVVQWKMENNGNTLKKEDFAPVLKNALERITEDCIKNGFRSGGLHPFGPDYIDFTKLRGQNIPNENNITEQQLFLKYLDNQIVKTFGQEKLAMYNRLYFESRNVFENTILEEDLNLYILWAHNKQKAFIFNTDVASTAFDNSAGPSNFRQYTTSTARSEPLTRQITAYTVASNIGDASTSQLEATTSKADSERFTNKNRRDTAASDDAGPSTSRTRPTVTVNSTSIPCVCQSTSVLNNAAAFDSTPEKTRTGSTIQKNPAENNSAAFDSTPEKTRTGSIIQKNPAENNSAAFDSTPEKTTTGSTIQKNSAQNTNVHEISSPFTVNMMHSDITPNKSGRTPQKSTLSNVLGLNVPTPFKRCLFWPEDVSKKKNIRNKDKVPSAVTSQAWQKYHQNKEEEKRKVLQEKKLRAKQRLERKLQKLEIEKGKIKSAITKNKKVQDISSSENTESEYNIEMDDEDEEFLLHLQKNKKNPEKNLQNKRKRANNSDSDSELPLSKLKAENRKKDIKKGGFVIIMYEGEYFPGKIENMDRGRYEVSTMTLSTGNTFRWPERPDKLWYSIRDIVEIINPPVQLNNRGFYKVTEMEKYLPDLYNYIT